MASFLIDINNPGAIRYNNHDDWQGLADDPRFVPDWDKTGVGYFRFTGAVWGLRAVARTLLTYCAKYGDDTLLKLFSRYAPPGDGPNNPLSYATVVGGKVGVAPQQKITLTRSILRSMLPAIARMEMGHEPPYSADVYEKALDLAAVK